MGPNGGKSTLLSILDARHADPGHTHGRTPPRPRSGAATIDRLATTIQLYPELTAREPVFFAKLSGVTTPDGAVDHALAAADLVERADDFVSSFSRGMRQRLALERALLHDPRLVLLDEPFTGLDRTSTGRLATRLGNLARQGGW